MDPLMRGFTDLCSEQLRAMKELLDFWSQRIKGSKVFLHNIECW